MPESLVCAIHSLFSIERDVHFGIFLSRSMQLDLDENKSLKTNKQ